MKYLSLSLIFLLSLAGLASSANALSYTLEDVKQEISAFPSLYSPLKLFCNKTKSEYDWSFMYLAKDSTKKYYYSRYLSKNNLNQNTLNSSELSSFKQVVKYIDDVIDNHQYFGPYGCDQEFNRVVNSASSDIFLLSPSAPQMINDYKKYQTPSGGSFTSSKGKIGVIHAKDMFSKGSSMEKYDYVIIVGEGNNIKALQKAKEINKGFPVYDKVNDNYLKFKLGRLALLGAILPSDNGNITKLGNTYYVTMR